MFLKFFKDISKSDVSAAGGKGASLGEMTRAGIPVPPGFVVLADAFEQFLTETDLNIEIDSILHTVKHEQMHTVENASEKIQALILEAKMPKDIAKDIGKSFKKLGAKYVAVRSSATAEDSATAAWAGQLDSFLNTTEEKLLENVQKCWASLFTPRAIFYRFEKGLHTQKISVAVVVQKMVESEVSGIAFSVHPVTQDYNQLIIEAALGLGEAIVSGQITPDSYVVEKEPRRIVDKNIVTQNKSLIRANGEIGNEWVAVPKEKGEKQVLTDEQILQLSELVLKIEKHYEFPVDIEWAYEKGKFYIVQSRPITTLSNVKIEKVSKLIFEKSITRDWPLFIVEMLHEGFTKEFNKQFNWSYAEVLFDIYVDHLDIYRAPIEHIEKMRAFILAELDKNQNFISKYSKELFKHYKNFLGTVDTVDKSILSRLSDKELAKLLKNFIDAHTKLEPTFVINFWFPIQMENHSENKRWEKEISVAAKTRAETEKVGPEGDRVARQLAQEISKRMFKKEAYAKFISLGEAYNFLIKGIVPNEKEIQKRMKGFVYGARGIQFMSVAQYAVLEGLSIKGAENKDTNIIKGVTAYAGYAKGKVRVIISKSKIGAVRDGEVLVTAMTTPEFMPALKKAIAFVTDEGGITSHAAIVSRELKKPCVIGTKIATQVLKDGDLVEVDANEGVVRVLKRQDSQAPAFDKKDFIFSFESQGSIFLFEDLILSYYSNWEVLVLWKNYILRVFAHKDSVAKLNKIGSSFTAKALQKSTNSIKKTVDDMEQELSVYQGKKIFSKEDAIYMFKKLADICREYRYFDIHYSDGMWASISKNSQAKKNVKLIENYKNEIRERLNMPFIDSNGWLMTLIKKLSKQFKISTEMFSWYTESEVLCLFENKKVTEFEIEERKKAYAFYVDKDCRRFLYTGEVALKLWDTFAPDTKKEEGILKGTIAHGLGRKIRGIVRIISRDFSNPQVLKNAIDKMQRGDILVSATTDPDFMDGLKKAGAIVTDVGGMLSHAAISARELDTPCIIGTRVATKILRDGDLVEVDANEGVVRILKKNK
ncbi:MAG: hypothetical protein HYT93_00510 [Parcubacteria group bacterium]|nr:hypothetical protein [Parcubacteria group bacterium]